MNTQAPPLLCSCDSWLPPAALSVWAKQSHSCSEALSAVQSPPSRAEAAGTWAVGRRAEWMKCGGTKRPEATLGSQRHPQQGPVEMSPQFRIFKGTRFQSPHLLSQRIFPVALHQKNLRTGSGRQGRQGGKAAVPPAQTWAGHLQAVTAFLLAGTSH